MLGGSRRDDDGLTNEEEANLGTDPNRPDTDNDGLLDGPEVNEHMTNPLVIDTDEDGLLDGEEVNEHNTDPLDPDMDDDGLLDGEEIDLGTKPRRQDSDEDGYRDGDEVAAGSDPLDGEDWIYRGGWPFNPDKDAIADPGVPSDRVAVGDVFPRVVAPDQYGDDVDLYNFAGLDRLIVIDAASSASDVSRDVATWLGGENDPGKLDDDYGDILDAYQARELIWLVYVTEGANMVRPATPQDADVLADQIRRAPSPVMTDPKLTVLTAVNRVPGGGLEVPSYAVVDSNTMQVRFVGDFAGAMGYVGSNL